MKMRDTLHMPQTEFAMKASLHVKEPKMQQEWLDDDVYEQILKYNEGKEKYIYVDGPPYANGNLHMGHALNKSIKDIILRYKNMSGYSAEVIWGWDTHGLPIENALLKNKKIKRHELTTTEFRKLCEEYANKQVENQKEQFMRLGILEGNKRIYRTLDNDFEAEQINIFGKMVDEGLIFKGLKPVYWSYSSKTALADAEIEYKDIRTVAIYVSLKILDSKYMDSNVIIWTTTPWTLPGNNGVCVNENLEYSHINVKGTKYIVASNLLENLTSELEWENVEVLETFKGKTLDKIKVSHPINDTEQIIMLGEHVTDESGTGIVHTSSGHGEDDFNVSNRYNIETKSVLDSNCIMNENAGKYEGLFYEDANKEITKDLEEKNNLLKLYFFTHSAPHDWRSKKPVIYRATEQWFATINPIKKELLKSLDDVTFINEWAKKRLYNMIESREEWCISRQRTWGVPIPIFYDQKEQPILSNELISHVQKLFLEHGSDVWFDAEVSDILPDELINKYNVCSKETDIMDVWFDSGSASQAVGKNRLKGYPADLYFEGSDQYRGWFNSSLIIGFIMDKKAPFKRLLSHGFVLDGKGNKMSKSIGNIIDPIQIANTKGSDIIRLWSSSVDYQSDVRLSDEILDQVTEVYRRYRNTIRFMLGNTSDFDKTMLVEVDKLNVFDKYMLYRLDELIKNVIKAYDNFEFKKITDLVNNYMIVELSAFYLDYIKDITYIDSENSQRRRSVQTVLYYHIDSLLKIMAPILVHTTYEAYKLFNGKNVFLNEIVPYDFNISKSVIDNATKFLEFRKVVNKAIEDLRNDKKVGKSFEVKLTINPTEEGNKVFSEISDIDLYCIVSVVEFDNSLNEGYESDLGKIKVEKFNGTECSRCRKYFDESNVSEISLEDGDYNVCTTCKESINEYK